MQLKFIYKFYGQTLIINQTHKKSVISYYLIKSFNYANKDNFALVSQKEKHFYKNRIKDISIK